MREEEGVIVRKGSGYSSVVHGSYSYPSQEGRVIALSYDADKDGFRPRGEHLPTPPPVPESFFFAIRLHELAAGRGPEKPPAPIFLLQ